MDGKGKGENVSASAVKKQKKHPVFNRADPDQSERPISGFDVSSYTMTDALHTLICIQFLPDEGWEQWCRNLEVKFL